MKSHIKIIIVAAMGLTFASALTGLYAADVSATVRAAATIAENTAMNFGEITSSAAGGNVVLAADGSITSAGGHVLNEDNTAAGAFTVVAATNTDVTITTSAGSGLTGPGGATMALSALTVSGGNSQNTGDGGTFQFNVGGTLAVSANQAAGTYSGQYSVSVAY